MRATEVLIERFDEVAALVASVLDGAGDELLARRVDAGANTVGWLVWHLTRVQDDHVADVAGTEQAWTAGGWAQRLDLGRPDADTGYGDSSDQVAALRASAADLAGYHAAVHEATLAYVRGLGDDDLDRVVDESWDPPVTLGVRLGSVVGDDLQHVGQAAFARGVLDRHP